MAELSNIAWTDSTFNPWIGCQKVSPGCKHCYAENDWDHRFHRVQWGLHGERDRTSAGYWRQPLHWNARAERFERQHGHHQRVFCASSADVFDNKVPQQWRHDLWDLIRATPRLDWMLLTKRPQNIRKMLPRDWGDGWPQVWLGTTCESQQYYDQRFPILQRIPAVIHFISYEPALGPLRLGNAKPKPDWVICGGESGRNPRWMNPEWAHDLRDDCAKYGIAFFMKQMTAKAPIPAHLMTRQFPKVKQADRNDVADGTGGRTACKPGGRQIVMSDDDNVVAFAAKDAEAEKARKVMVEVKRLAGLATADWRYQVQHRSAKLLGIEPAELQKLVEAEIKDRDKAAKKVELEDRRREQRAAKILEKEKTEQKEIEKEAERKRKAEQKEIEKEAERKSKEKQKAFATIVKLPSVQHEAKLPNWPSGLMQISPRYATSSRR